jgi:hypothetical protein
MDQTTYYTINRSEINNKLLIDEMNKVNEAKQRRKSVSNNGFSQK